MGNLPHNFEHCRMFNKGRCKIDKKYCGLMSDHKLFCIDYCRKRRLKDE